MNELAKALDAVIDEIADRVAAQLRSEEPPQEEPPQEEPPQEEPPQEEPAKDVPELKRPKNGSETVNLMKSHFEKAKIVSLILDVRGKPTMKDATDEEWDELWAKFEGEINE